MKNIKHFILTSMWATAGSPSPLVAVQVYRPARLRFSATKSNLGWSFHTFSSSFLKRQDIVGVGTPLALHVSSACSIKFNSISPESGMIWISAGSVKKNEDFICEKCTWVGKLMASKLSYWLNGFPVSSRVLLVLCLKYLRIIIKILKLCQINSKTLLVKFWDCESYIRCQKEDKVSWKSLLESFWRCWSCGRAV